MPLYLDGWAVAFFPRTWRKNSKSDKTIRFEIVLNPFLDYDRYVDTQYYFREVIFDDIYRHAKKAIVQPSD